MDYRYVAISIALERNDWVNPRAGGLIHQTGAGSCVVLTTLFVLRQAAKR
jgi:hypothetical protein